MTRYFTSSPPPPYEAEQWPSLIEVFDAIRSLYPQHLVTLLNDQVVAVPARAKGVLDAYGQSLMETPEPVRARVYRAVSPAWRRFGIGAPLD